MALFRKRTVVAEPNDLALTFFSISAANEFRSLAARVFADIGVRVVIHPDHAVDQSGRQFGFWNVDALCAQQPGHEWHDTLLKHLTTVLDAMNAPSPFDGLDQAEAEYRTYSRLYDAASVPSLEKYPHQEFAPGIVEMLALDLPDAAAIFKHEDVRHLGGFAALRSRGVANLEELPVESFETLPTAGGGSFHALLGESVYTASRALLRPSLATTLSGDAPNEHGWLMSVPNRHQVVWHVIKDDTVVPAIQAMTYFTRLGFGDSPGPLSPHVFWCNGSSYEQLTRIDDEGSVSIHVSPRFHAVLEAVTAG